jgi:hypothetical protein
MGRLIVVERVGILLVAGDGLDASGITAGDMAALRALGNEALAVGVELEQPRTRVADVGEKGRVLK